MERNQPKPSELDQSQNEVDLLLTSLSKTETDLIVNLKNRRLSFTNPEATAANLCIQAQLEIENFKNVWTTTSGKPKQPQNSRGIISGLKPLLAKLTQTRTLLALEFLQKYPDQLSDNLETAVVLATGVLLENDSFYDGPLATSPDRLLLVETLSRGLATNQYLDLLLFSCPEIDAAYLTGPYPDDYLSSIARTSTGVVNKKTVLRLTKALQLCGINVRLNIVTGFADEEDYIFPVLGSFGTNSDELRTRRQLYVDSFREQSQTIYNSIPDLNIINWSEINTIRPRIPEVPTEILSLEVERLTQLFGPDRYYAGLPLPTLDQLYQISTLKMQAYGQQGREFKRLFPNAIGLQNEFPGYLRTWMINQANAQSPIPYIYPFSRQKSLY